jgi:hypothetical protein
MGDTSISGMADPIAETRNSRAANTSPFLRPRVLLTQPPKIPPKIQPIRALDTTSPSLEFEAISDSPKGSTKNFSRDPTVPEITAVSYPNRSPPRVATRVMEIRYPVFEGGFAFKSRI